MSRVLVTGASGRLGTSLVASLRADGHWVRALVHRRPVETAHDVTNGDLVRGSGLEDAVRGIDAIVHLAACTHARAASRYEAVNVGGTTKLLAAARGAGVRRFVHVSTRAVDPRGGAYSRSKADAEAAVTASQLPSVIVRLPEIYGTGGTEGVDGVLARARSGRPVLVVGSGDDQVCPIVAEDAVSGLLAAHERGVDGATYTLAGECMSVRSFAERCMRAFRSDSRIVGVPEPLVRVAAQLARVLPLPLYPDQLERLRAPKPAPSGREHADLGFAPRRLEDVLGAGDYDRSG